MANDIIPKQDGIMVENKGKTLFFPNAELINIGCRNCVWRFHEQCPHSITEGKSVENGICHEMFNFVVSLAEGEDSISAVWEKFLIYKVRLQESEDYADFLKLKAEIQELEKDASTRQDYDKIEKLRMNRTAAKMWWARLNQQAAMFEQKVVDREVRKSESGKVAGIFSADTINFNIAKKDVVEVENGKK